MSANGATHANASQWFSSNIFIIFVVVLLLILLVIGSACWLIRRNRDRTNAIEYDNAPKTDGIMTEIEIFSVGSESETDTQPKFTLKIKTNQSHATQLVEMFVRRVSRLEGTGPTPAVTPPTVTSPTDGMPLVSPHTVLTENLQSNESVTPSTPHARVFMSEGGPHPHYRNTPTRQQSSEQLASDEEEEDEDIFFYEDECFGEVQNHRSI